MDNIKSQELLRKLTRERDRRFNGFRAAEFETSLAKGIHFLNLSSEIRKRSGIVSIICAFFQRQESD
jgi:hypothetical protein